jgi:ubiquitin-protein ligase
MSFSKRWNVDLMDLLKDPIDNILIHYDESNITKINIIIIGPSDTPYENGFYPFEFSYKDGYPFTPPEVKFLGRCLFKIHPNLHPSGYVCLSLLNTENDSGWKPSMTLKSLILSLISLFTNNPLKNEPLYETGTMDNQHHFNYHKIAEFYNFKNYIDEFVKNPYPKELSNQIENYFISNYEKYQIKLVKLISKNMEPKLYYSVFDGDLLVDYSSIDLSF